MVRKKLPKNDMEMYIPPGSSLPQTAVRVTKAAKNSGNLASYIEKEKTIKERKREVYIGEQKRKPEYKMQTKKKCGIAPYEHP